MTFWEDPQLLSLAGKIALGIFLSAITLQLLIHLFVFGRLARYKEESPQLAARLGNPPKVSVVICARNEGPNLRKNLPRILDQDYPAFEVIVVNDDSTDDTAEVLERLRAEHPHLKSSHHLETPKPFPGKKFPLTMGIKAAQGEIILLTDADCYPASSDWIAAMASKFEPGVELVLGLGRYEPEEGWLNKVVQWETFHTFLQYASWALAGRPYMGVGRNLAYRRDLFFKTGGFSRHQHIAAGDDDLFVNSVANRRNTRICFQAGAETFSQGPSNWVEWREQKTRHLSVGRFYKASDRLLIALYTGSHVLSYVTIPALFATNVPMAWLTVCLPLRWLVQMGVYYRVIPRVGTPDLWYFSTIFDFLTVGYYSSFVCTVLGDRPVPGFRPRIRR